MPLKRIIRMLVGAGAVLVLLAVVLRFVPSGRHPEAVNAPVVPVKVSGAGDLLSDNSGTSSSASRIWPPPMAIAPVRSDGNEHDALSLGSGRRAQARGDKLLGRYEASPAQPAPGTYKPQHDADINGIMDQLCSSETDSARLAKFFVEVMLDPGRDVVQRDYAIQHLRVVCRVLQDGKRSADGDLEAASKMACDALFEVVPENTCCLAGTALLALAEIAGRAPATADQGVVSRLALERARDAQADEGIRVTALLVGAQMQDPDALTVAWQILDANDQSPLRLAAISALAAVGNQDTVERLNRLGAADETERKALDAAIRRISGRKT